MIVQAEKDRGIVKTLLAAKKYESCCKIVDRLLDVSPECVEFQLQKALCLLKTAHARHANDIVDSICARNTGSNKADIACALYYRGLITCQITCPRTTKRHDVNAHKQGLDLAMTYFEKGIATDGEGSGGCIQNTRALNMLAGLKAQKVQGGELYVAKKYKDAADVYVFLWHTLCCMGADFALSMVWDAQLRRIGCRVTNDCACARHLF